MVGNLNHLDRSSVTGRADELLAQFNLADAGDRPLKTYSGGMRRRLDLAAALVARPTVLFLDEPTTGLDPQSRNDLWEVIESLVGGGTTVLLTTQYLEEADRLANTLAVLDHGHVIAEGTPARAEGRPGATVLEVGLATSRTPGRTGVAAGALGSPRRPWSTARWWRSPWTTGPQAAMAGAPRARPRRASPRPPSPCASPAWTTCSWPSPAAGPRRRPRSPTTATGRRGATDGYGRAERAMPIATGELS